MGTIETACQELRQQKNEKGLLNEYEVFFQDNEELAE